MEIKGDYCVFLHQNFRYQKISILGVRTPFLCLCGLYLLTIDTCAKFHGLIPSGTSPATLVTPKPAADEPKPAQVWEVPREPVGRENMALKCHCAPYKAIWANSTTKAGTGVANIVGFAPQEGPPGPSHGDPILCAIVGHGGPLRSHSWLRGTRIPEQSFGTRFLCKFIQKNMHQQCSRENKHPLHTYRVRYQAPPWQNFFFHALWLSKCLYRAGKGDYHGIFAYFLVTWETKSLRKAATEGYW